MMFQTRLKTTLTLLFMAFALAASFFMGPVSRAVASTGPDFSISASPTSRTIERGGTAVYNIQIQALNGFTGTVTLTDKDPFAKTVPSFSSTTVNGSGTVQFSVFSNGHETPIGTANLTVTGTSGSLQHSVQVSLTVIPVPDFTLFSNPFTSTVKPGGTAVYQLQVKPSPNFPNPVSLSITGLPANATASFTAVTVNVPGSSELDIHTTAQTPTGSFTLTLLGTSSTTSHTLALTLEVIPTNSDFTITVSPASQSISKSLGENAVYTVHVTAKNGFIGTVTFATTGEPTNVLGFFNNPNTLGDTVTGSGDIDFLFDAAASPTGTFTLTIIATSGPIQHTIQVTCTVTA
jgi:hypothetical protein